MLAWQPAFSALFSFLKQQIIFIIKKVTGKSIFKTGQKSALHFFSAFFAFLQHRILGSLIERPPLGVVFSDREVLPSETIWSYW
jgi:hypothetical protein